MSWASKLDPFPTLSTTRVTQTAAAEKNSETVSQQLVEIGVSLAVNWQQV